MYLIAIAWMYVVLMMSIAEATSAQGTLLGAVVTFVLYGLLPCGILMYLLGTPARRAKLREREKREALNMPEASGQPDASRESPTDPVSAVREK